MADDFKQSKLNYAVISDQFFLSDNTLVSLAARVKRLQVTRIVLLINSNGYNFLIFAYDSCTFASKVPSKMRALRLAPGLSLAV